MNKEWYEESSREFANGFTELGSTPHTDSLKPRIYTDQSGSWCVRDHETLIMVGEMRGQPRIVQWCGSKAEAEKLAHKLNATRGHASDEL
jgi:hypothetical protein